MIRELCAKLWYSKHYIDVVLYIWHLHFYCYVDLNITHFCHLPPQAINKSRFNCLNFKFNYLSSVVMVVWSFTLLLATSYPFTLIYLLNRSGRQLRQLFLIELTVSVYILQTNSVSCGHSLLSAGRRDIVIIIQIMLIENLFLLTCFTYRSH